MHTFKQFVTVSEITSIQSIRSVQFVRSIETGCIVYTENRPPSKRFNQIEKTRKGGGVQIAGLVAKSIIKLTVQ